MGGNRNSKLIAAGVGASIALGGLAAYYYSSQSPEQPHCHHEQGRRQHEGSQLNPSPVASPATGLLRGWSGEQLELLQVMQAQFESVNRAEGAHLDAGFFALKQEILALRTSEKLLALKKKELEEMAKAFKEMRYSDYHKQNLELAIKLNEILEEEEDRINDVFDEPMFIQASRIYLLRYDPEPLLKEVVVGAKAWNKIHLKMINQFNLKEILTFVKSKIAKRKEQGFEFVDKENFVVEFRLQLETEVLAKFNTNLDEVWAFCALEHLGEDKQLWDETIEDYVKMLKAFIQGQSLYSPGIKVLNVN